MALAASLAACQKAPSNDVSSATPEQNPATAQETPPPTPNVPDANAPVPAQSGATTAPPKAPATGGKTASGKSTGSKSTAAVPAADTRSVSLPAGTSFDVSMTTSANTGTSNVGDKIEATLLQPLKAADSTVIANTGAVVRGEIAEVKRASHSKSEEDRATLKLNFTSIETVDGEKTLNATVVSADLTAGGTGKRDALVIGGAAALGAVLGKVIGKDTKGAVIGAVGGAVLGTGAMMAAKGHEMDVPAGTKITLRAEEPITVVAR
jgi:hypothetical protein